MAEIEHFCDPTDKAHPKFVNVAATKVQLYSACNQMDGKSSTEWTIGEAVATGLVANETLGYFLARIQQFLLKIGILPDRLRFRQHMSNEMAHYACDCWDAECLTSYGWVECVGCADRSAYDLNQHFKATGVKLAAEKKLPAAKTIEVTEAVPNKAAIGKQYKKDAKSICEQLAALSLDELDTLRTAIDANGQYQLGGTAVQLTKDLVTVKTVSKTVHVEEIIPNVIEPSFGIGRIMYSLLEHRFNMREGDEQRCYISLPPVVAPIKCSVLPLSNNAELAPFIQQICKLRMCGWGVDLLFCFVSFSASALTQNEVSHKVDSSSGSIGRRYARTDEIAIPYGITIDFDTLKEPSTVTLRERDSMQQLRIPVFNLCRKKRQKLNGCLFTENVLVENRKFIKPNAQLAEIYFFLFKI